MMSREFKDTMQIIDKETLEIVAELKPEPGKTFAHVEFTKDGKYNVWNKITKSEGTSH